MRKCRRLLPLLSPRNYDIVCCFLEGVQFLSDELSEVSDNLKLTVQFLSDDFAAVSELSGKNLR